MEYDKYLVDQFSKLEMNLVKHDTSPTGLPCYIEVHLMKNPKDKGTLAKDLSNYLFRLGFRFQVTPEYRGKGKKTTIRYFMSWDDMYPHIYNIQDKFGFKAKVEKFLPVEFNTLIIQNASRGVYPNIDWSE